MRVLAISGSHLPKGNTSTLIGMITGNIEGADIPGLRIKKVTLSRRTINPCRGCGKCMEKGRCVLSDDFESIARKMMKSDLIIIGSPVYFHDVTGQVKNLIDRTYSLWHERRLKGKKVIPVAVSAESGEDRALETLRIWAQAQEMKIVRSVAGHGYREGDVLADPKARVSADAAVCSLLGELQGEKG